MVNHYGQYVPSLATMVAPLNRLLAQGVDWQWADEQRKAVQCVKDTLTDPKQLAHYDPDEQIVMATDASPDGIGAVIHHRYKDGTEKAIEHASKTLSPAERNYSQIEKEALSIVYGVTKFHRYLFGRTFTLITDHKPLLTIFGPHNGIPQMAASRLQRWAIL